ncbi:ribosomal protein S18-alanine N-acetyltransferase [Syntrophus buswellii]|jgi:ribosomal-protein-alanine N-acetyltransferase|uniref:ribosomal protein S18-alanine N-acetyltransferase n=1 Tax=Syntrophus buswellii TaxID=43774 RepID=UPI0038D4A6F6
MFSDFRRGDHGILRAMDQEDLDEVMAVEKASFQAPWTRAMFLQELSTSISRCVTLREPEGEGRRLAGYMIYWMFAQEAHLQKIAVRPECRRRHAADCLMKALLQTAREERCRTVILEVRRSNTAARKLYEKFGLTVKGIRSSYYPEEGEDALIMGADLKEC